MFQALKNYLVESDNKVVTKDDVVESAELAFTAISKNVLPTLKAIKSSKEYFNSPRIIVLAQLGSSVGVNNNDPESVVKELISIFKNIVGEEKEFIKLINENVRDKMFPALITAQEVAIMKTVTDISSLTLYVLDMMYYITITDTTEYPSKKVEELRKGVNYLGSLVRAYGNDFDKHVAILYKVSKTEIKQDATTSLMDKLLAKHGKLANLPLVNGFINNPIYHIRLWFVDRDIDKYESLKDKKKLIELKLLDLKLRANDKHDESLGKQIAYYEDKISGIEYEIKELEDE